MSALYCYVLYQLHLCCVGVLSANVGIIIGQKAEKPENEWNNETVENRWLKKADSVTKKSVEKLPVGDEKENMT